MGKDNPDRDPETLRGVGEDELIARLTAGLPRSGRVIVATGDDCAVVWRSEDFHELLKTDCLVEGVHYETDETPGEAVGWKALCRALSDIAAMGGLPEAALITLVARPEQEVAYLEAVYAGLKQAAERYGVDIVGGETSAAGRGAMVLSVALSGRVEPDRCVLRSGASVGQGIYVTGKLGGSLASGRHLNFEPRLAEARWLTERAIPQAMMDLSDGLAADLPRLANASGVGYRLDFDAVPMEEGVNVEQALGNGEDYELLFTADDELVEQYRDEWEQAFPGLGLTRVGQITETVETPLAGGWKHF